MNKTKDEFSVDAAASAASQSDWRNFLLLALVGLPVSMGVVLVIYGYLTWFSQLLIFGPPS